MYVSVDFVDDSAHADFWERWITRTAFGLLSQDTNLSVI